MTSTTFPRPSEFLPVRDWDAPVELAEAVEIHGAQVADFTPLLTMPRLRSLWCSCDTAKQYAIVAKLQHLDFLRIDFCGKHRLQEIGRHSHVKALELNVFHPESLEGLESFAALEYLFIVHAPKITSFAPLASLAQLKGLLVTTPPSWDASRRTIRIQTIAPLSNLRQLEQLSLTGVEPTTDGLQPLHELTLEALHISHVPSLTLEDYARLAAHLPHTVGACLQPTYQAAVKRLCPRCGREMAWLTGTKPRAKKQRCPVCEAEVIQRHVDQFHKIVAQETAATGRKANQEAN